MTITEHKSILREYNLNINQLLESRPNYGGKFNLFFHVIVLKIVNYVFDFDDAQSMKTDGLCYIINKICISLYFLFRVEGIQTHTRFLYVKF